MHVSPRQRGIGNLAKPRHGFFFSTREHLALGLARAHVERERMLATEPRHAGGVHRGEELAQLTRAPESIERESESVVHCIVEAGGAQRDDRLHGFCVAASASERERIIASQAEHRSSPSLIRPVVCRHSAGGYLDLAETTHAG